MKIPIYCIRIEEELDPHWEAWFSPLRLSVQQGHTLLRGEIDDQAILHGILERIRNLNLTLLYVEREAD